MPRKTGPYADLDPNTKVSYSVTEAAEATGVSPRTIHEAVRDGRIGCRWVGTKRVIPRAELEAWVASLPMEREQ